MRSYQVVIREAELLASPPQVVVSFLEKRGDLPEGKRRNDNFDEEFEAALLSRQEPLINLALARYAKYSATVRPLFEANEPGSAIRLAILANTIIPDGYFSQLPLTLMEGPENVIAWLLVAPDIEIKTLFENPLLNSGFIQDLLAGKGPWNAIPQERLCLLVKHLAGNPRMWTPYTDTYLDGSAEYQYNAVFTEAWLLAEKMPVTRDWALVLSHLYERLIPQAFSIKDPLELASRWVPDPSDTDMVEEQQSYRNGGYLHPYQELRKGLARLALAHKPTFFATLLEHEDVAFRSAAYSDPHLGSHELGKLYERDGELAFNQACRNPRMWRTEKDREALRAMAWQVDNDDKHSNLDAVNLYTYLAEDFEKLHPEWFKDDADDVPEVTDEPATKADIAGLRQTLVDYKDTPAEYLAQNLKKLESRVGWIFWFSLGALAMGLKHM